MSNPLLSVTDALERILARFSPLSVEHLDLPASLGRVLAEDVVSREAIPGFSSSAMDGFAVVAADLRAATERQPVRLPVIGDIPAGTHDAGRLSAGAVVRITTGAPIPQGADAVVPVEWTDMAGDLIGPPPEFVIFTRPIEAGSHIRLAGQDVSPGETVLRQGRRLAPPDLGMLAALGHPQVAVFLRPRVAVIATGSELLEIGQPLEPGMIRDSNSYAIEAALRSTGALPVRLGVVPDDARLLEERLDQAADEGVDLILSTAGVSMGAYDFVRGVIENHGELNFWKVNIRPGKPLVFGAYRGIPFFGLPGNPVSALVSFEVFVKPALAAMSGMQDYDHLRIMAILDEAVQSDGRESYLRAVVRWDEGAYHARLTGSQDSGVLSSLVVANALLIVPAGERSVPAGRALQAWVLNRNI